MIPDLLRFAGVEVVNSARTQAYVEAGFAPPRAQFSGCGCGELAHMLRGGSEAIDIDEEDDATYVSPFVDDAPWVDDLHPESLDFAGIVPLGVESADDGTMTRTVIETLRGSRLGPQRCGGPRRFTFRGVLVGSTCCSVDYGLRWLRSVLVGSALVGGGAICGGDSLEFLTCCPDCERQPGMVEANCDRPGMPPDTGYPGRPPGACGCFDEYVRCAHDVVLEAGPTVVERHGSGCGRCGGCPMIEVEWTWVTPRPWDYGLRRTAVDQRSFPDPIEGCDPEWDKTESGNAHGNCDDIDEDCSDPTVCDLEPPCGTIPPPPVPRGGFGSCVCDDPLSVVTDSIHIGGPEDFIQVPCNTQLVPTITLYAGNADLRNVTIRFHEDPLDQGCDQFRTDGGTGRPTQTCQACSVIHVTRVPAGGQLVIDGESEISRMFCNGGVQEPVNEILYGAGGGPFSIPALACSSYCVTITADSRYVDDAATWSMSFTERSL